jgi:hypothetical protein
MSQASSRGCTANAERPTAGQADSVASGPEITLLPIYSDAGSTDDT